MRLLCAFVLAASLWVLPLALGGDAAVAVMACGMFDGKFECRAAPGGVAHGKNATPGAESASPDELPQGTTGGEQGTTNPPADMNGAGNAGQGTQTVAPGEHACPPGYRVLAVPTKFGYCEPPGHARGDFHALPTRNGRHATQRLPLPEEFRIIGRQLRSLQRDLS